MQDPATYVGLGAAIAVLPLLFAGAGGRGVAPLRILLHLVALEAFGAAAWLFAREGEVWAGGAVVFFGFVWTGVFWIVSIRRRLSELSEIGELPAEETGEDGLQTGSHGADDRLEPRGRAILDRLLAMREQKIGSIATPRESIVFADCAGGVDEAADRIRKTRHLRIPMVDGSLDRIVGVVHAKDVVPLTVAGRQSPPLKKLMRRPLFVSHDQTAADVLELFRLQRGHLAIVVDAYNRTRGLVSRDDLFRHLTGESEAKA